jgi:SAM-dependent methyltransferase
LTGKRTLLDATNRIRNLLGNYRYVSYQIRLWKLRGLLGSGERNVETLFVNHALKQANLAGPWSTLDLGCGNYPRNPFGADHTFKETESMDFITAYEFIEHVPRLIASNTTRFPFVELMSEIHRVLKPGGFFFSKTPSYPSNEVFQDPTHVNFITNNTFPYYFCWHPYGGPWGRIYGFNGKFALVQQRREGIYLFKLLQKIA